MGGVLYIAFTVTEVLDDLVSGHDEGMDYNSTIGELVPLFYQPGKPGFYSIRVGSHTASRLNAYRNIGRYPLKAMNIIYCLF